MGFFLGEAGPRQECLYYLAHTMRVRPYRRGLLLLLFALFSAMGTGTVLSAGDTRGLLGEAEREYLEREMAGPPGAGGGSSPACRLDGLDHGQVTYLVKGSRRPLAERVYSVGQGAQRSCTYRHPEQPGCG